MNGITGAITDQFTTTGASVKIRQGYIETPNLMVKTLTGSPSWIIAYQGSPDGENWTTFITHDSTSNVSGETIWIGAEIYPCLFQRLYCVALSGGTVEAMGWGGRLGTEVR